MLVKEDEFFVWQDLRGDVMSLLGVMYDRRDSIKATPWEGTPKFDRLERLMSGILNYIDGQMQELDAGYSERNTTGLYRRQAELAREYGINYIPFQGSCQEELPEVFSFISAEGLASMDYEQTCKARDKYYQHLWTKRRPVR